LLLLIPLSSCEVAKVALSQAEGMVSNVQLESDLTADGQGNPDYAVTVYCNVKNVGEEGKLLVTYMVTSSEGDWTKQDDLYFRAGETRSLTKLFPEPSFRASGLRAYVKVYPTPTGSG
jgi:hypothetical protein